MVYQNCIGYSHSARVCIASITGPQKPEITKVNNSIEHVLFSDVKGFGGKRSLSIENTHSSGVVDNICISNCMFSGRYDKSSAEQAAKIGSPHDKLGSVRISNTNIVANSKSAMRVNNCHMSIESSFIESEKTAIKLSGSCLEILNSIVRGKQSKYDVAIVGQKKGRKGESTVRVDGLRSIRINDVYSEARKGNVCG